MWFIVFLFSLSFHESAHAWTSEKFGDYTGRQQGRITLNPIAHIDPIGTLLLPLIGFTQLGFMMFGWAKPVQTNPLLWRDKTKANIMVSAAGPISNLILATIAFVVIKVLLLSGVMGPPAILNYFHVIGPLADSSSFMEPLATLLSVMLLLNITLAVFNLVPVPPLDGSHVLESLLPYEMAQAYDQIRPYGFILLLALIWLGVFGWIINPIFNFVIRLLYGI